MHQFWTRFPLASYSADDLVVLAQSDEDLQKTINGLESFCTDWGLTVNTDKIKYKN